MTQYSSKIFTLLLIFGLGFISPVWAKVPDFDYYNYMLDAPGPDEPVKCSNGKVWYTYKSHYTIYDNKIVRFVQDDRDEHPEVVPDGEYKFITTQGSKIKLKVANSDIIDFQLLSSPKKFQAKEDKIEEDELCYMTYFWIDAYNTTKRQNRQAITGYGTTMPNEYMPQDTWDIWLLFYFKEEKNQPTKIIVAREVNGTDVGAQAHEGRRVYTWSDKKISDIYPEHKFTLAEGSLEPYDSSAGPDDPKVDLIIDNCQVEYYNPKVIHFLQLSTSK